MKKRVLSMILTLVMAVVPLAACGTKAASSQAGSGAASTSAGQAAVPGDRKIVKYWYPWGGDSEVWDKWRMDLFNQSQDEYFIEGTYVPEGSGVHNGKLMAAINSGDVPDVVVSDAMPESYSLAIQGAFEPLDDALKAADFDLSKVNPKILPLMQWDGVTYIVPQNTDTTLLFYRTDLFEEAGLDPNAPPKTIEELDAMADKLTVRDGEDVVRYGFIPWLDAGASPSIWSWQFDGQVYDKDTNTVVLANDNMKAMYEWQRSYAQKFDPERMKSFTSSLGAAFSPDHAFMQGKVAMTAMGNWFCNALRIYAPDIEYKVAPLPAADPAKYGGAPLAGNVFFCPKGAKELDGAIKFIEFCQSPEILEDNNKQWRSLGIFEESIEGLSLYKEKDPALMVAIDVTFNENSGVWGLSPVTTEMSARLEAFTDVAIYTNDDIMPGLEKIQADLQKQADSVLGK